MKRQTLVIKRWLKANHINVKVRCGREFVADCNNNVVYYSDKKFDLADLMFYDFARREGLEINCGLFVAELMHEVGHLMTDAKFSNAEQERFENQKNALDAIDDIILMNRKYFAIEDELTATHWGIDFINSHIDEVENLINSLTNVK